jgi:hypothetical protein
VLPQSTESPVLVHIGLDSLPTAIVDIGFQLPADEAGDAMREPYVPEGIIPLLIEVK